MKAFKEFCDGARVPLPEFEFTQLPNLSWQATCLGHVGVGNSKQAAKNAAAEQALTTLTSAQHGILPSESQKSALQMLHERCSQFYAAVPETQITRKDDQWMATVTYVSFLFAGFGFNGMSATASTKQEAKQVLASQMLERFECFPALGHELTLSFPPFEITGEIWVDPDFEFKGERSQELTVAIDVEWDINTRKMVCVQMANDEAMVICYSLEKFRRICRNVTKFILFNGSQDVKFLHLSKAQCVDVVDLLDKREWSRNPSLARVVEVMFLQTLSKDLQTSFQFGKELTREQMIYAVTDAVAVWEIFKALSRRASNNLE